MKHKIEFNEECKACKGTGIYSGIGEYNGCAVVCHDCKGTGCFHFVYEYKDFKERRYNKNIRHIYECNPGIKIGESNKFQFSDFGGMSYDDWFIGKKFTIGMENRKFTCPAWWYQSANYELKPNWSDNHRKCIAIGSFTNCEYYNQKDGCWKRFDKENKK